jgi:hypothetical protein
MTSKTPALLLAVATLALTSPAFADGDVDAPMNSPALFGGGIAVLTTGAVAGGFGAFLLVGVSCACDAPPGFDCGDCALPYRAGGAALSIAGLGGIIGGIAMMVIGARDEETTPQIHVGVGNASATWSF